MQVFAQEAAPIASLRQLRDAGVAGRTVHARGVITCVEKHHFFLQDASGAMQVQSWNADQSFAVGDAVTVRGVLLGFGGGMQMRLEIFTNQGQQALPEPETVTAEQLVSGGEARCQRVRLTGAVHDVAVTKGEVRLLVRSGKTQVIACWRVREDAAAAGPPDHLLDALVELTGVAHSGAAPDGKTVGGRIPLGSLADLRVLKPGSADVFSRPLRTLASLRETPAAHPERFRTIGTVTFASVAGWFYFQDATGVSRAGKNPFLDAPAGAQRRAIQPNPRLQAGDVVEVVGYVHQDRPGKSMPWLVQSEWRVLRHEAPPLAEPLTSAALLAGDFDGKPASVAGQVTEIRVDKDRDGFFNHLLTIESDGISFWALVQMETVMTTPVKVGDYVRLDGVVLAFQSAKGITERFRLNLNDFTQVRPAKRPWQVQHLIRWLLGGIAGLLVAVVWIVVLRLQVRRQTARLREANDELSRFKAVADSSTDLIAMASLDQRPLYINPAGRKLLGFPLETAAGSIQFTDFYTPESIALFEREGFAHALEHGHWSSELIMQHQDGRNVPVSFVGLIIKSADGRPQYMSCIARDISERRRLETHLREALEQERHLNHLKSNFVNTTSHEFRTPLGIILFASSMLRRFDDRFGPEERAGQLDAIDQAVERMNDLVEQSLTLGRAEVAAPGQRPFDVREFSIRVIDEVMSATSHRSPIRIEVPDDLPQAVSDETMLRAILSNLLGNAVKYSPGGSPVVLRIERAGAEAVFTVRDHGPGLREEDMPKLFTTFQRGSGTAGIPGSGLGLAIVKRCAEALGGTAAAGNANGGGAQFTVRLPLFANASKTTPSISPPV